MIGNWNELQTSVIKPQSLGSINPQGQFEQVGSSATTKLAI